MSHDEPINVEWQQNAELRRVAASSKQPAENGVARGGAATSEARAGQSSGTKAKRRGLEVTAAFEG